MLETYGRVCHLQLPDCTLIATTKDHLIPLAHGGTDDLENFRPACHSCNSKRQDKALRGFGARVIVLIGPPAAGKSTYIRDHAQSSDITIDLDELARALMPIKPELSHYYPEHVRHVAIGARQAAIDRAVSLPQRVTVWLIHAVPRPKQVVEYARLGYAIHPVDPGRAVVEQRVRSMRPQSVGGAVARWYDELLPHLPTILPAGRHLPAASASPAPALDQSVQSPASVRGRVAAAWLPPSESA